MDEYESILLVKPEVFVYRIPPRTTNKGYRAADWDLGNPNWTGRMRVVVKSKECYLKLEDKISGELFAQSPIDKYPGLALEAVTDSSRYFVVRIQDEGGKAAFIGLGFGDRSDSFDLNVALQDHFKYVKKEEDAEKEKDETKPVLDLGFKEGETIKINMKITKKDGQDCPSSTKPKTRPAGTGLGILPPPPGGVKLFQPPPSCQTSNQTSNVNLFGEPISTSPAAATSESWGEFASAKSKSDTNVEKPQPGGGAGTDWVTF